MTETPKLNIPDSVIGKFIIPTNKNICLNLCNEKMFTYCHYGRKPICREYAEEIWVLK